MNSQGPDSQGSVNSPRPDNGAPRSDLGSGRVGDADSVHCWRTGALGRIRLNRPRSINALREDMVITIAEQLEGWADDDQVRAVLLDGAGERGLCAGGDVRLLREIMGGGDHARTLRFWADEYALNEQIAEYPKPYVVLMDGVTMGGGVGLSVHGSVRLATGRSRIAMPETAIGFFPDVGTLYHLARMPGLLGTHLALTGEAIDGSEAVALGMADHVVTANQLAHLTDALVAGRADPLMARSPERVMGESVLAQQDWIDRCYAEPDAPGIIAALRADLEPAARAAGKLIATRSPVAVMVTLAAIRRARTLSLHEVFEQDRRLGAALLQRADFRADFLEGVRALLVDRDGAPRWRHRSVADIDPADVEELLER